MDVDQMEIGNLLFGHSYGEYPLDHYDKETDRLGNLLYELGLNSYGHEDEDLHETIKKLSGKDIDPSWLEDHPEGDDQRRLDIIDPNTHDTLMIVRSYWWGEYDTPEDQERADAPNLEIPSIGFQLRWYKYYGRDSYSNYPLNDKTMTAIITSLKPALDEARKWLPHFEDAANDIEWITDPNLEDCESARHGAREALVFLNDRALHEANEDRPYDCYIADGRWQGIIKTSPNTQTLGVFDSREDAEEWVERRLKASWVNPDGTPDDRWN